ncbi:hypothetical protein [Dictyobacter aurantiacus]|uniref:DUF4932 domain-containing protein n=1 Tax=Dictyobacter aurantiacus TaxID=1936993 RepID=A0A401ZIP8_9CHLR|nr:hypothetical protein [Dictyobacter aurantiacus]GCE06720.1 hypothetical protein KDAU_40490 [Dictyobacter aurantiacus]
MHTTTRWYITPSLVFDMFCWINILTGDPFYVRYYAQDYEAFQERLTPEIQEALRRLKTTVKDEGQQIISALLCLYFSATADQTLDDVLRTLADSDQMYHSLRSTPYYQEERWALYTAARPDLTTIVRFLQETDFEGYWRSSVLPRIEQRVRELQEELGRFNIVVEDEAMLGASLPSDELTVYVLYYVQPHGIRVTGTRFITDVSYPAATVARIAVHEMFHPPFDQHSPDFQACLASLCADPFLARTFEGRNPDYGYNTFKGFIEESCVRALEQLVNEKFGIARSEARERWRDEDEGMHVFAACLYAAMRQEAYNTRGETFQQFLLRMVRSTLRPGTLEQTYHVSMTSPSS